MKTILLILFIAPLFVSAQKKGDNTIIINEPVSLTAIKTVLFENGFNLVNNDTVFLTTSSKQLKLSVMSIKMMMVRSDSSITVRAVYKSTAETSLFGVTMVDDYEPLKMAGMKGSPLRDAWNQFVKIVEQISPNLTFITK